jgi:hypothetical protein
MQFSISLPLHVCSVQEAVTVPQALDSLTNAGVTPPILLTAEGKVYVKADRTPLPLHNMSCPEDAV